MSLFAEVDQLKEELDALRPLSAEQEARILQKFRLDWNYNSNAIEGNSLTLGETRSLLLHGLTAAGKPIRDHLDIRGHNDAVVWLEEVVRNEQPLSGHFIREMHEVLLGEPYEVRAQTPDGQPMAKTIYPGRYKSSPNNVLTATGEMFYFASPEETPARMTDLVDWYNKEAEYPTLHPVALAAEFHYRFVSIHPFDDGNGRMSRLLMNLILMRGGYPMTVIRASDRNRYLAALSEADAGEIEPFFSFVGESVAASMQLMIRAAKGESIDEIDDLDKKLALFRKEISAPHPEIESNWNIKTQEAFVNSFLSTIISDLTSETNRFDSFFENKYFYIQTFKNYQREKQRQLSVKDKSIESILTSLNRNTNSSIYSNIQFIINWNHFHEKNHFNANILIEFIFKTHNFSVSYKISSNLPEYILSEHFGKIYIQNIEYDTNVNIVNFKQKNNQIANELFDFISSEVVG